MLSLLSAAASVAPLASAGAAEAGQHPVDHLGIVAEHQRHHGAIDRAGRYNVHVIFRTAGEASPIESEELASLRQTWRRDEERSSIGFALDRSGIYGGFHCYGRC